MRKHVRTLVVLVAATALVALFLSNVDLRGVAREIVGARPSWLVLSFATMFLNLVLRSVRWQYLLEPLGPTRFGNAFRATAVGFAASSILPARAGEVIRPYFLSRHEHLSATGAFATIIIERLLDMVTVLILLASFVFVFGRDWAEANAAIATTVKVAGAVATAGAAAALVALFVLAKDPARLGRAMQRIERSVPSAFAALMARIVEKFATGLGALRRPGRVLVAMVWSFPLWLSIAVGIWAGARAFDVDVPFTGSFLFVAVLVIGVMVPTPGYVGGFHEAFRVAATVFYGASDAKAVGAAIVLHLMTVVPSLGLGLFYAAQAGLNLEGMRRLADEREQPARDGAAGDAGGAEQAKGLT